MFRRSVKQVSARLRSMRWPVLSAFSAASSSAQVPGSAETKRGTFFSLSSDQCAICAQNASYDLAVISSDPSGFISYAAEPSSSADESSTTTEPPQYPITAPYKASCGHVYCYFCLSERLLRAIDDGDEGWDCLRCTALIRSCNRVNAVSEDDEARTSDGWQSDEDLPSFHSDISIGSEL